MSAFDPVEVKAIKPIRDHIIVRDMNFDIKLTSAGLIIPKLDMKTEGIHPRWAEVYAVGPDQKDVTVGQFVCVAHGRWTRGLKIRTDGKEMVVRRVDNDDILLVSDEPQSDDTVGRGN
jgi:co-chaperonin GroES (HSP10)